MKYLINMTITRLMVLFYNVIVLYHLSIYKDPNSKKRDHCFISKTMGSKNLIGGKLFNGIEAILRVKLLFVNISFSMGSRNVLFCDKHSVR